ncbi:hypothetical protein L204_100120 [Cryptococcus depauperatus]|nr:hypothetical protein L204_02398 [Cryptococcus depauperatus CBS 7855]
MNEPWANSSWPTPAKSTVSSPLHSPKQDNLPATTLDNDPWAPINYDPAITFPSEHQGSTPAIEKKLDLPGWDDHVTWDTKEPTRTASPAIPLSPTGLIKNEAGPDIWMEEAAKPDTAANKMLSMRNTEDVPAYDSSSPSTSKKTPLNVAASPVVHSPTLNDPSARLTPAITKVDPFTTSSDPLTDVSSGFGDEFGGFSSFDMKRPASGDDPWSTGERNQNQGWSDWGETSLPQPGASLTDRGHSDSEGQQETIIEDKQYNEGWSSSPRKVIAFEDSMHNDKEDDDWKEAQRKIRIQEKRAPRETIESLRKSWMALAECIMEDGPELEKKTGAEELMFEKTVKTVYDDAAEILRSLSVIPPEINTYPPVLSSLTTHERFTYALHRPNPDPESSFLATASSVSRRPKRVDPLTTSLSFSGEGWMSRSKLGEPESKEFTPGAEAEGKEESKSRWSFWGRRPQNERQLTTSGGGILEIKSIASTSTGGADTRPSTEDKPPIAPSRPPSVAGTLPASRSNSPASSTISPHITENPPPIPPGQPQPQAPSAVSRFFGRLGRKTSSIQSVQREIQIDSKDLELSASDFSFLAEVPSMTKPSPNQGIADLLSLEPGANEPIASLENLLNSKTIPLPKPLAPPPQSFARGMGIQERKTSGEFVGRDNSLVSPEIDLLGELDFTGQKTVTPPVFTGSGPSKNRATRDSVGSTWGECESLVSPPYTAHSSSSGATLGTKAPVEASQSQFLSTILPQPSSNTTSQLTMHMSSDMSQSEPLVGTAQNYYETSDFEDFGGFNSSQLKTDINFDDFGDFPTLIPAPSTPLAPLPVSTPSTSHSSLNLFTSKPLPKPQNTLPKPVLDHRATLNLLTNTNSLKGKRWPAPSSPIPPTLEPPPKGTTTGVGGFPFLTLPPGSKARDNLLDDSSDTPSEPPRPSTQGLIPTPSRSLSSTPVQPATVTKPAPSRTGLSQQDLSFFDGL